METNKTIIEQDTPRENIRKKVLKLERVNFARKPECLKDRDMVEKIKRIIEQEVDGNDH